MRLENKTAVITGGSAGIGLATARLFAREGAQVIIAGSNICKGEKARSILKEEGLEVLFCRVNVSVESDVRLLFAYAEKSFGRLDCLVCDAGVGTGVHSTIETDLEMFRYPFEVNTQGTFLCVKYAVPLMLKTAGKGTIVNISSLTAHSPKPGRAGYIASKAAISQMTKVLAVEFAPDIRINCVAPGLIDTDNAKNIPPKLRKEIESRFPAKRLGRPEEVAAAILFLSCDESSYIYGTEIFVDGGDGI